MRRHRARGELGRKGLCGTVQGMPAHCEDIVFPGHAAAGSIAPEPNELREEKQEASQQRGSGMRQG